MKALYCRHKWMVLRMLQEPIPQILRRCLRCQEVWEDGAVPEPKVVLGTFEDEPTKD